MTRTGLATLVLLAAGAMRAEACDALIDRVAAETGATVTMRSDDLANLAVDESATLTVACGDPSAIGVQWKGASPPPAYYALFGRVGRLATEIEPATLEAAAREAQGKAVSLRHGMVGAGGGLVTCSVSAALDPATPGAIVTACSLIDRRTRS